MLLNGQFRVYFDTVLPPENFENILLLHKNSDIVDI